jgi:TPR repeat protein
MKTATETFDLLSKLLSEQSVPDTIYHQLHEKLFSLVTNDFSKKLEKSTYPQKAKLISRLKEVLANLEILTQFPEMIGRTTVGILGTNGKLDAVLLDHISNQNKAKIYKYNKNVPAIIYKADQENLINAVNLIESPISLSEKEFRDTNLELFKHKIDIRQFLFAFSISANIPYSSINYINFPFYSLKTKEYYSSLLSFVDTMIIPVDEKGNWKTSLDILIHSGQQMDIVLLKDNEKNLDEGGFAEEILAKNKLTSIQILQLDEKFDEWLFSINKVRNNLVVGESFLSILSDYFLYQTSYIKEQTKLVEGMNHDLINIDNEETQESLRKLRKQINENLSNEKIQYRQFKASVDDLLDLVTEFEQSLENEEMSKAFVVQYRASYEDQCSKLIMNLIESGELLTARTYMEKLSATYFPFSYIFDFFIKALSNKALSRIDLKKLREEKSETFLVLKAKVFFGDKLELTNEEIAGYALLLPEPLTGYENYVIGSYFQNKGNIYKAKLYYNKALENGYVKAGEALIPLADPNKPFELENLANMLIPEANYLVGINCLMQNRYARGISALKIAAVFEHHQSIRKLADIEFVNVVKTKKYFDDRTEKSMNIAMQLYHYLISNNKSDQLILENLGKLYFWKDDYRTARELLEGCQTPEAKYICGKMYQYGNGVAQDLPKARDLFHEASRKGHRFAAVEYEKVCGWIASNQSRDTHTSGRSYSTHSTSTYTGSSKGCFLTTATCLALGKEDNCEEILAFKKYRDEQLINDQDGSTLIREYYRIAPEILKKISIEEDKDAIFQMLYDRFIAIGYAQLLNTDFVEAKATYIKMVEYLCERYQVNTIFN